MSASRTAVAADAPAPVALTEVTEAAALDDRSWFTDHPDRRFRARSGDGGLWLIRRRRQGADFDVLLRTFSRTIGPSSKDGDSELAALWYRAAYPDMAAKDVIRFAKKAVRP